MWIVKRRFNAKDKLWNPGDQVPIEEFTHRAIQSMTSLGWIIERPDPPEEEPDRKRGRKKAST